MTGPRVAWAFLTRLPGGSHPESDRALAAAVMWFPLVGAAVGAMVGTVHAGMSEVVGPLTAATVAVAFGAIVTGGFHEDGLADTADSFGGYDRERRLEIMRDSRVGTFGVLALVFVVLVKVAALASLDAGDGFVALVGAHAGGRAAAVLAMRAGPGARADGLAAAAHDVPARAVVVAVAVLAGFAAVGSAGVVAAAALIVVGAAGTVLGRRHLGGVTGDLLGAVEQIGEVVVLVVLAETAL